MTDVCIDIETLGTRHDAVILSIGAVRFEPNGELLKPWARYEGSLLSSGNMMDHERLHIRLDVGDQVRAGHAVDCDTLEWWTRQDERARAAAFGDGVAAPMPIALRWLNDLSRGVERFWAQGGLTFDFPILETAYACAGIEPPWRYNQLRDVRTLVDGHPDTRSYGIPHHAMWDAFNEARWVQAHYRAQRPWWKRGR